MVESGSLQVCLASFSPAAQYTVHGLKERDSNQKPAWFGPRGALNSRGLLYAMGARTPTPPPPAQTDTQKGVIWTERGFRGQTGRAGPLSPCEGLPERVDHYVFALK